MLAFPLNIFITNSTCLPVLLAPPPPPLASAACSSPPQPSLHICWVVYHGWGPAHPSYGGLPDGPKWVVREVLIKYIVKYKDIENLVKDILYIMWHLTSDNWHMTWHIIRDIWHVGGKILSKLQLLWSHGLGKTLFWRYFHKGWLTQRDSEGEGLSSVWTQAYNWPIWGVRFRPLPMLPTRFGNIPILWLPGTTLLVIVALMTLASHPSSWRRSVTLTSRISQVLLFTYSKKSGKTDSIEN